MTWRCWLCAPAMGLSCEVIILANESDAGGSASMHFNSWITAFPGVMKLTTWNTLGTSFFSAEMSLVRSFACLAWPCDWVHDSSSGGVWHCPGHGIIANHPFVSLVCFWSPQGRAIFPFAFKIQEQFSSIFANITNITPFNQFSNYIQCKRTPKGTRVKPTIPVLGTSLECKGQLEFNWDRLPNSLSFLHWPLEPLKPNRRSLETGVETRQKCYYVSYIQFFWDPHPKFQCGFLVVFVCASICMTCSLCASKWNGWHKLCRNDTISANTKDARSIVFTNPCQR